MNPQDQLLAEARQNLDSLQRHLTQIILPAWLARGWDSVHGGFHERLDAQGKPQDLGYKRLHAIARQLYVLSEWSLRWNKEACSGMAHQTFDYLVSRFWDEKSKGWMATVTTQGQPGDLSHELYGHAFAIFALARYGNIFSNPKAVELARKTLETLDGRMRHPLSGYFSATDRDWKPVTEDLNQNPHMHLLEALQVLGEVDGSGAAESHERSLAGMMGERLFDKNYGVIREHFDRAGKPHPEKGRLVEPGHQFEWYWLVKGDAQKAYGASLGSFAERMYQWGVSHGLDRAHGGIYDACDVEGRVLQTTKRIWPTTEFIRASACRWRREGDASALSLMNGQLRVLLGNFLHAGGWYESLDEGLRPLRLDMPATTCYHLTTCYLGCKAMLGETE